MGYYTNYQLETNAPGIEEEIARDIANRSGYEGDIFRHAFCEVKWYEHERDMLHVSKRFPNVVFILSGEGEENNDVWKKRFLNGEVWEIRPEVSWPEFPELTDSNYVDDSPYEDEII